MVTLSEQSRGLSHSGFGGVSMLTVIPAELAEISGISPLNRHISQCSCQSKLNVTPLLAISLWMYALSGNIRVFSGNNRS